METVKQYIAECVRGWGSEVKVIKPNGKVTYEKAYCYEDTRKRHALGHKQGKKVRG